MKKAVYITISFLFLVSLCGAAYGQIVGPPLGKASFEGGYTYKWFHRDLEPNKPIEMEWEVASFFARYGITDRVTISFEGGSWEIEHDDFPGMEWDRITVGGGITVRVYEYRRYGLSGFFHYNEILDTDRSSARFRKQTRGVLTGVQVERGFKYRKQKVWLAAGVAYVWDQGKNYVWGERPPLEDDSENNIGIVLSASALIHNRLATFVYLVYADYWQPRVGVALRW